MSPMHIGSEPEADPVALAHEMISLLRSVRTPGGAVSAWPRHPCRLGVDKSQKSSTNAVWPWAPLPDVGR